MNVGACERARVGEGPTLSLFHSRTLPRGFTLLEILISLAILALAVATILPLFAVGTASHKNGIDQTRVRLIAPHIAARIQERLYSPNPVDLVDQEYSEAGRSYRYDAAFTPLDPRDPLAPAFIVKVKVKWLENGVEQGEQFETILLRKLPR